MHISAFDMFRVGIGPSSSHTVGPMRAALMFVESLVAAKLENDIARIKTELYGSLGATGVGHGSPKAVILGLMGDTPEDVDVDQIQTKIKRIREAQQIQILGRTTIEFIESRDLILNPAESLPYHANGMEFKAFDMSGNVLFKKAYYSIGGGFVVDEDTASKGELNSLDHAVVPYPFSSAKQLLELAQDTGLSIAQIMLENEKASLSENQIFDRLDNLWKVMSSCIKKGMSTSGILPGGLNIQRRAPELSKKLANKDNTLNSDCLASMDWVNLYAMAVNEENASGGRIVTAPTNGAAGIIPAVLQYFCDKHFDETKVDHSLDPRHRFFLTAAAIGTLYKKNASISGAEVGCQGEVGSACSMAAAGLTEVLGGTPEQVENAAEIAMEHNLGLTCDPVGGLVQVPCIERNGLAAVKAINASRLALRGDGNHFVSLDDVIKTMRETGRDMQDKYKETSRGGLAAHAVEVPVNIIEC